MITRSNKLFEEIVAKGLELSKQGDYFAAVSLMKEQGIPSKVIARVLCQQHLSRSSDLTEVQQS